MNKKHFSAAVCCAALMVAMSCVAGAASERDVYVPGKRVQIEKTPETVYVTGRRVGDTAKTEKPKTEKPKDAPVLADTAIYRGVMSDVAVDDSGRTVFILEQADGTNFGAPVIHATITNSTKYTFDSNEAGNGSYLEVHYGGELKANAKSGIPTVEAVMINQLSNPEMILYNGTIVSVTSDKAKKGSGSILLDPVAKSGMQWVFHYTPDTKFYTAAPEKLKSGDKLNVVYNGISTRSIPPQSTASEVYTYHAAVKDSQLVAYEKAE